jgi:Carboxypeptidase regulatory-like domain
MKTQKRKMTTHQKINRGLSRVMFAMFALTLCLAWAAVPAVAQTAGEGTLEGTVTDSSGAVVGHATVTVINTATGVQTVRDSSSAGFFSVAPLLPGTYTVQVAAKGFKTLVQDNVVVDATQTRTITPILTVGTETQTVTVTAAPPVLDTADATIGLIVENSTYTNLPIQMSNAQRDPTAFGILTPGAQTANNGGRLPIVGGTGSYLGQLYVDGMPAETVSQQGDNRLVSLTMDLDAVDQFQMVTSTPPAEYAGAGAENFTMKSGGLQYHGQASDFLRNTAFDSWGFQAPWATYKNLAGQTVPVGKPVEHQNELSVSAGGKVPKTGNKLFFFGAYDRYHERKGATYSLITIPSNLMTQGNFTELNGGVGSGLTGTGSNNPPIIYDPMSTTTNTASCPTGYSVCRLPFEYNGTYNVIPPGEISTISQALQQFIPSANSKSTYYSDWNSSSLTNNYLSGWPSGFDNWVVDWRVDYDVRSNHRISSVGTIGTENYLNNYTTPLLPPPLIGGDLANIYPKNFIVEDAYTFSPNVVNQLKYGFTRFFQNIHDATEGTKAWNIGSMGITNLPGGQAGVAYPEMQFGSVSTAFGGLAESMWRNSPGSYSTQLTTPNNYAVTDNVQWLKGRHALTMGLTFQWQEINNANPATLTGYAAMSYNPFSTANYSTSTSASGATLSDATNGFSYASFLLGASGGSTTTDATNYSQTLQYVSEEAGRYKTISPYVRDSYKVNEKLTLDIGLRWDYLPPYHELRDRWSFLNPTLTNPLTNSPGMLQFAGSYGGSGASCGCTTPVHTYWKNWGPRVGAAYSINNKTVLRAGFGLAFSQSGGVGGRGGSFNGTGQTGFNVSAIGPTGSITGPLAGPAYWLNSDSAYLGAANANTGLFGPGFTYPGQPTPSVTALESGTGFYVNPSTGKFVGASGVSFADPYLSGRAPELVLYNFGIERAITPTMTLAVNYVGNESHFIINSGSTGGNARGYWTNELNPTYLAVLGPVLDSTKTKPLLAAQATPANLAILAQYAPNAPTPAFYTAAGALASGASSATIQQMLVAFPQYSGVTDTWGNVGNFAYNALQLMIQQRPAHGLTFNFNYTYSKNLGDDGTYRSGWALPGSVLSRSVSGATLAQNRIDRSWTVISTPQVINIFGVYQLPFGKGELGGNNAAVRWLAGGWQLSEVYNYLAGTPMAVSGGSGAAGQGQTMPDMNPGWVSPNARQNGSYGSGPNGFNVCNIGIGSGCHAIQYVNPSAFISAVNNSTAPGCIPGASSNVQGSCQAEYLIGNAPRTAAYGLRNPGTQNLNAGLRRSFPLGSESRTFVLEANCFNVWNKVTFSAPSATWANASTTFGTIGSTTGAGGGPNGARDWQFAGHLNF